MSVSSNFFFQCRLLMKNSQPYVPESIISAALIHLYMLVFVSLGILKFYVL